MSAKRRKPDAPKKAKAKPAAKKPAKAASPKKPLSPAGPATASQPPDRGQAHRDREAARRREISKSVKEVGPLPGVVNPARKARGRKSLQAFAEEYFPRRFKHAFADPHLAAIASMEACTDRGGKFAAGMPRGMGKTTLAEVAVIRAIVYGFRRFVMLVCATTPLAKRRLKQILKEFESNKPLSDDFPEACHCIRKLERVHQRAKAQELDGRPTLMEINSNSIVLPTIEGSPCSGSIIVVAGMGGAVRGQNILGPDGEPLRPDMVLLDDVQTRKSATSPTQTTERESMILDDILGSAGGDVEIAAVMLCTVIATGDLSDRFLSHDVRPEWQGVRTRMLEAWPKDLALWDQYAEVRRESFRSGDRGRRANTFYIAHRAAMDAGARVSWESRKKPDEVSAIQSAMNLFYDNPRGFKAEYQNEPESIADASAKRLNPVAVAKCLSGLPRFAVPRECTRLVAFIDAGGGVGRGLWYGVFAADNDFGGSIVDYGAFPRQVRSNFLASDMRPGLAEAYPGLGDDERLYAGLAALSEQILDRIYYREVTGEQLRVERLVIDAGWKTHVVYRFARESRYANVILPSKGVGRTIRTGAIAGWKPRPGERSGYHWRVTISETGRGRMLQFDPDMWKTFVFERFTTVAGGRGRLTLFASEPNTEPVRAADHEMFANHCSAEGAKPAMLKGDVFDKWEPLPNTDNHLFDVIVGCQVAASERGLNWSPSGSPQPQPAPRRRLTLGERMREKERAAGLVNNPYPDLIDRPDATSVPPV